MKPLQLAILVGVLGLMGILAANLVAESSTYATFAEAKTTGAHVHVAGQWVQRQHTQQTPNRFVFVMEDSLRNAVQVVYDDPMPANFQTAERVVVSGRFQNEVFHADKILMKCPSKYEETELANPNRRS